MFYSNITSIILLIASNTTYSRVVYAYYNIVFGLWMTLVILELPYVRLVDAVSPAPPPVPVVPLGGSDTALARSPPLTLSVWSNKGAFITNRSFLDSSVLYMYVPGEHCVGRERLLHHPLRRLDQVAAVDLLEHSARALHVLKREREVDTGVQFRKSLPV